MTGFPWSPEPKAARVIPFSRNGKIISHSYIEVAKALIAARATP